MFERLVESKQQGAVPSRRNYFAITTIGMSLLSLSAIVVSIFADDYSIGRGGIELSELLAPVEMATAPEQPQPKQQAPRLQTSTTKLAMRTDNVVNIAETPTKIPPISTAPSNVVARPLGERFQIGPMNTDSSAAGGPGRDTGTAGTGENNTGIATAAPRQDMPEETPAPAIKKAEPVRTVSLGVINGKATSLPTPAYPAAARAVGAAGAVDVQVLIDEDGRVVSAHAAGGHPLLRAAAERAALSARFTPTKLSNVPVKVTGIITYNFMRS